MRHLRHVYGGLGVKTFRIVFLTHKTSLTNFCVRHCAQSNNEENFFEKLIIKKHRVITVVLQGQTQALK